MNDFPILTVLWVLPLVGAVAVPFLPRHLAKQIGLGVALATLVVGVVVAASFDPGAGMQMTEQVPWIEAFGVNYALGVDGLGLLLVLLTALLVPVVLAAEWTVADDARGGGARAFVAWTLALEALSLAVFLATDVFLFYVVFEATLIPAYFLIGGWGRRTRSSAAVKFLMFQLAGGLVLLASVIGLYVASAQQGTPSYLLSDLMDLNLGNDTDAGVARWLFVGFFAAFAIKAPLFPVHTWLADTTEQATPGTSVLLVCVLDKIGTFGMLRFCLGLFPEASQWATPVVVTLALISIVYGALVAIGQDDVLRLIGLTSLSHFGFITLGIFVFTSQGQSGAILYMVNHGLGTAALFLLAGYLVQRRGTTLISEMGGLEKATPVLAGLLLVAALSALGLPGLSTFVSEFLVILAAFDHHWWVGAVAVLGIVLAAIYALWMYQRIMTGGGHEDVRDAAAGEARRLALPDLGIREIAAVAPLMVGLVFFGFYPAPLFDVSNPTVESLMEHVGVSDPEPVVAEVPAGDDAGTDSHSEGGR